MGDDCLSGRDNQICKSRSNLLLIIQLYFSVEKKSIVDEISGFRKDDDFILRNSMKSYLA